MRKVNKNTNVGKFEIEQGLPPGTFRRPDGRDQRSDTKFKTLRKRKKK